MATIQVAIAVGAGPPGIFLTVTRVARPDRRTSLAGSRPPVPRDAALVTIGDRLIMRMPLEARVLRGLCAWPSGTSELRAPLVTAAW